MADKGKGKSYCPFKKLKLDPNSVSTKEEEKMRSSTNGTGNIGGSNSGDMEGVSYQSRGLRGLGKSGGTSSMGRAKYEAVEIPGLEGIQYKNGAILEMEDAMMKGPPSTKYSRDTVKQRYKKALVKNPESYSISATTIQQQAAQESNFIGSAFFYNLNIYQVQDTLGGNYVVVYARPKTSVSYPRGSAVEVFDPNLELRRITIHTDVPKKGHPDEKRIRDYLSRGYWGCGMLHFNGIRLSLAFGPPESRRKDKAEVFIENFEDIENPTGIFENAVDYGCHLNGSTARFGVKEMIFENHVQYGFQFIELNLSVVNQITKLQDFHHVVAIKIPNKRDISSTFLLKQRITMPPISWYKFQKHITRELNKLGGLLANVEKVASDWYESEEYVPPEVDGAKNFWKDMSR
ncbi:hypothetical protein N431DRAFT_458158 [Stipitochalara longipes BDJ]|nr:hypothetical protein N431DRAFT_458158 [Stipitochalara longipes BDJ]